MNKDSEQKQMKDLPQWLQRLWEISPMLARTAENDYINLKEQLRIGGVSISDSLDMKIKTLEHIDELIDQKLVCFKSIPELQKKRIELNAQIKLLRHLKNN